jgi:hypothetical protein
MAGKQCHQLLAWRLAKALLCHFTDEADDCVRLCLPWQRRARQSLWWCMNSELASLHALHHALFSKASALCGQRAPSKNLWVSSSCVFIRPVLPWNDTDMLPTYVSCHGITSTATSSSAFRFSSSPRRPRRQDHPTARIVHRRDLRVHGPSCDVHVSPCVADGVVHVLPHSLAGRYATPCQPAVEVDRGSNASDKCVFWYNVTLQLVSSGKNAGLTPENSGRRTPVAQNGSQYST